MRASQALDFILRDELPDRSQWDRVYSHISDFYSLTARRREIQDEMIAYGDYENGALEPCTVCHKEIDTSHHSGERMRCQHCGHVLHVRHRP